MEDATVRWADAGIDTLTKFVTTGKLDFKSLANSIIQDLVRINLQKAFGKTIGDISSGIGGFFSGLFGTADAGTTVAAIPQLAGGGDFDAGRPFIAGERGPELVVPRSAGTVIPNDSLMRAGGNTTVSVSVDARGTSASGTGQGAGALGDAIGQAVRAVIVKERRPGGLLA